LKREDLLGRTIFDDTNILLLYRCDESSVFVYCGKENIREVGVDSHNIIGLLLRLVYLIGAFKSWCRFFGNLSAGASSGGNKYETQERSGEKRA